MTDIDEPLTQKKGGVLPGSNPDDNEVDDAALKENGQAWKTLSDKLKALQLQTKRLDEIVRKAGLPSDTLKAGLPQKLQEIALQALQAEKTLKTLLDDLTALVKGKFKIAREVVVKHMTPRFNRDGFEWQRVLLDNKVRFKKVIVDGKHVLLDSKTEADGDGKTEADGSREFEFENPLSLEGLEKYLENRVDFRDQNIKATIWTDPEEKEVRDRLTPELLTEVEVLKQETSKAGSYWDSDFDLNKNRDIVEKFNNIVNKVKPIVEKFNNIVNEVNEIKLETITNKLEAVAEERMIKKREWTDILDDIKKAGEPKYYQGGESRSDKRESLRIYYRGKRHQYVANKGGLIELKMEVAWGWTMV